RVRSSRRQSLIARIRFILFICAVVASGFSAGELLLHPHALGAQFAIRLFGIGLAVFGLFALRRPWAVRYARFLAIAIIAVAYFLTGLAGIVSPEQEYVTTAVLFVGAALVTATMLPWGGWAQSATVLVGALMLAGAIWLKDGSVDVLATDPGAAVTMAFALSIVTAREFQRYRVAHWRELQDRQRAEHAVRRLNTRLEERVAERTAALE